MIENHLLARHAIRVVAVSNFTAGTLSRRCQARVLPPGLSFNWFRTLVLHSARKDCASPGIRIVTAFRLTDWEEKGLPQLLKAISALRRSDIHLTICGTGECPTALHELIRQHDHCSLLTGLRDQELAHQLAVADLLVLATRTRFGSRPSGEGFGLVLLEAQVAGTPVVGPAHGGSREAYLEGVTGVTPVDETPEALANVLRDLLKDPRELEDMGNTAAVWARKQFAPGAYALDAIAKLL